MLTANLICMQVQGECRWWGRVVVVMVGFYSLSNLHVKCWPGQLMGKRGIVCPPNLLVLRSSPLHDTCLAFSSMQVGKIIVTEKERCHFT